MRNAGGVGRAARTGDAGALAATGQRRRPPPPRMRPPTWRVATATHVFSEASGEPTASWHPLTGHLETQGDPASGLHRHTEVDTPAHPRRVAPGPVTGSRPSSNAARRDVPTSWSTWATPPQTALPLRPSHLQRPPSDVKVRVTLTATTETGYGDTPFAAGLRRQRPMTTRPEPNSSVARPISHSHVRNAPVKARGVAGTSAGGVVAAEWGRPESRPPGYPLWDCPNRPSWSVSSPSWGS